MITDSTNRRGSLLIIISAIMFASYGVWSRLIGDAFGVFFQGWTRALLVTLILTPIVLYKKGWIRIARKDWGWLMVYLIFTSLTQAPIFYAFNHMDIGTATLLFFTSMMLTMYVVGFVFLGEKLTPTKAISFGVAAVGLYTVFSFSLTAFVWLAAAMAILNGIASGGEVAFSKKLSNNYSPLFLTVLSWIIIVLTNAPLSWLLRETQIWPSWDIAWLYQLGYTVASIFGFWLIILGLKWVEASIGGLLGLLEIVFSIGFGIIIFHEQLTGRVALGAALIIVAAALPHFQALLQKYKSPTAAL